MNILTVKTLMVCAAVCCLLLVHAGCGSPSPAGPDHTSVSRDEIKERVDNATLELDKAADKTDVKTNIPSE
mgnify:FL=1